MSDGVLRIPWRVQVLKADPDFARDSRFVREYEFSAVGRAGSEKTHEEGLRVFKGFYDTRGPYAPDE